MDLCRVLLRVAVSFVRLTRPPWLSSVQGPDPTSPAAHWSRGTDWTLTWHTVSSDCGGGGFGTLVQNQNPPSMMTSGTSLRPLTAAASGSLTQPGGVQTGFTEFCLWSSRS